MMRSLSTFRLATVGILALALALAACGGSSSSSAIPNAFVGTLPGTDAFVSLTTTGGNSLSYVCDSKQISTWFKGAVTGNALDLTADNGDRLKATLAATGATGTFTTGGKDFPFTAAPAKGDAGLYRAEQTSNGVPVVGGWILTTDGQQRGAIANGSSRDRNSIGPAPPLMVAQKSSAGTWMVQTPTFGALTVKRVVEPEDHRG